MVADRSHRNRDQQRDWSPPEVSHRSVLLTQYQLAQAGGEHDGC